VVCECKAWNKPIDKTVVAKADYVARDLGASKAIVVALEGMTIGGEQSAGQLGVEIWGPE
jgi:hypothetical protein